MNYTGTGSNVLRVGGSTAYAAYNARMIEPVPTTLSGTTVDLIPLSTDHAEGLFAVASPGLFDYLFMMPAEWSVAGFREYLARLQARPQTFGFTIIDKSTGWPAGISCYLSIVPEHDTIEIGTTWIGEQYQSTSVNPESKLLLLRNAFESLGAFRVQFVADARNARSRRAIAKLGATEEGTLRSLTVLRDGYRRDTVYFSILRDEWPAVERGLDARVAAIARGASEAKA